VRFVVVSDERESCPYLPGRISRLPLRLPLGRVTPGEFDRLLALGDRRAGPFLYRTACDDCRACEPIRIPVDRFVPTPSQRRTLRKNDDVAVELASPEVTPRHVEIYDRHRIERGLARNAEPTGPRAYRMQFVESCVNTVEVRYSVAGRMIAFSILDLGATAVSSVYHCFDPDEARRSPGVYSALWEIAWCAQRGFSHYYLGLWVGACPALAYKAGYFPHQRRIGDEWVEFSGPP
jgi:arginyl-tRNA--protein-N-Asp/Glu arginylyltransferase